MAQKLERAVRELIATAKTEGEVVQRIHDAGYRFTDYSAEDGYFNVYIPRRDYDGAVRIYRTDERKPNWLTQTWRRTVIKYSGVPTFFG